MTKRLKAVELFLAVGLAASVAACSGTSSPKAETRTAPDAAAKVAEGGEGGESASYTKGEQANADFKNKLSGAELLSALKEGGYIIYIRHGQTEKDYADQADPKMKLNDCETQRKLSPEGVKQAEEIGASSKHRKFRSAMLLAANTAAPGKRQILLLANTRKMQSSTSCPLRTTLMRKKRR